jgi:hypothetical protein
MGANFPCGNSDNGAHYKKSSKGVGGIANRAGAWGDKGDNQKGAGASGAGMSPPHAFLSSYEDNFMWSHVPIDDGNSWGWVSQRRNVEESCNTAVSLLLAHIRGSRKGNGGDKTWDWEETDIVNGIWPGVLDSSLLTRFIAYHFSGNAEAYAFSCWANSRAQEDPNVAVHVKEWLFSTRLQCHS